MQVKIRFHIIFLAFFSLFQVHGEIYWNELYSLKNTAFDPHDFFSFFDLQPNHIDEYIDSWMQQTKNAIEEIISIPIEEKTYGNTVLQLDHIKSLSNIKIAARLFAVIEVIHINKEKRDYAHEKAFVLESFLHEYIDNNKNLYNALRLYYENNFLLENLSLEERYFVKEEMEKYKRLGIFLEDDQLESLKQIDSECIRLASEFERNIPEDENFITVTKEDLDGVNDEILSQFELTDEGSYIVSIDRHIYADLMSNCTVVETRKSLWKKFVNRAYPKNHIVLNQLIDRRDEKAKLCGFESFRVFDLSNQMAKDFESVDSFLNSLLKKIKKVSLLEFERISCNLPQSVILSPEGKLYPWDLLFLQTYYYRNNYLDDLNSVSVNEYFPIDHVMNEMFTLFGEFLSLEFNCLSSKNKLIDDWFIIQVFNKTNRELLGTLILDLFPRPGKFHLAACKPIIPGVKSKYNEIPSVTFLLANFSKSSNEKPSLLSFSQVKEFFHEFGHAMHIILAKTEVASCAGIEAPIDFIEVPSMLLEQWMTDFETIKSISSHYITGEKLSEKDINRLINNKNIFIGSWLSQQLFLSKVALDFYGPGKNKDVYTLMKNIHCDIFPYIHFDYDYHYYARFAHLQGYASKYYGYLWSLIIAVDLFSEIKKYGLSNGLIGKKLIETILMHGGGRDSKLLIRDFLGRDSTDEAFFDSILTE